MQQPLSVSNSRFHFSGHADLVRSLTDPHLATPVKELSELHPAPTREEVIRGASLPSILRALAKALLDPSKFVSVTDLPPDPSPALHASVVAHGVRTSLAHYVHPSRSRILPLLSLCFSGILKELEKPDFVEDSDGTFRSFSDDIRSILLEEKPRLTARLIDPLRSLLSSHTWSSGYNWEVPSMPLFLVNNSLFFEVVEKDSVRYLLSETTVNEEIVMSFVPLSSEEDLFSLTEMAALGRLNLNPVAPFLSPEVGGVLSTPPFLSEYRLVTSTEGRTDGVRLYEPDLDNLECLDRIGLEPASAISSTLLPSIVNACENWGKFPVFYRGGDEVPVFSFHRD